jgi:hypothetical protein
MMSTLTLLDVPNSENQPAVVRPRSVGPAPRLADVMRRLVGQEATPDLRSHCPVCGHPYQPGEGVLALTGLAFVSGDVNAAAADDGDASRTIFLGHHSCVLPRLLTLLAGFRPDDRFIKASKDFASGRSVLPERHHDGP